MALFIGVYLSKLPSNNGLLSATKSNKFPRTFRIIANGCIYGAIFWWAWSTCELRREIRSRKDEARHADEPCVLFNLPLAVAPKFLLIIISRKLYSLAMAWEITASPSRSRRPRYSLPFSQIWLDFPVHCSVPLKVFSIRPTPWLESIGVGASARKRNVFFFNNLVKGNHNFDLFCDILWGPANKWTMWTCRCVHP